MERRRRRIRRIFSTCLGMRSVKRKKQMRTEQAVTMVEERRKEYLLPSLWMKNREKTVPSILRKTTLTEMMPGWLMPMEDIRSTAKKAMKKPPLRGVKITIIAGMRL